MINKTGKGNIMDTDCKHIAFAVNTEGINDSGFAGSVARLGWEELKDVGAMKLGSVISKKIGDKTYHALVCHSLKNGWGKNQAEVIKQCFDNIDIDDSEEIASIAIGTGFVGMLTGANPREIVCGMCDSKKNIVLYGFSLEAVKQCYEEERGGRDL